MEGQIFKLKPATVVALAFVIALCLVVITCAIAFPGRPGAGDAYGRWISAAIFLAILVAAIRWNLRHLAAFEVDETGFLWRGILKNVRYEWGDLVRYQEGVEVAQGYTLYFNGGRSVILRFVSLQHGEQLKAWIDDYVVPYIGDWIHKAEPERGTIVSVVSERVTYLVLNLFLIPIIVFGAWIKLQESPEFGFAVIPLALAIGYIVFLVVDSFVGETVLTEDELRRRTLLHRWSVQLPEVWEIYVSVRPSWRQATIEVVTLVAMGRRFELGSGEAEYTRLKNALIERCPWAIVYDSRPPAEQSYLPRVDFVRQDDEPFAGEDSRY